MTILPRRFTYWITPSFNECFPLVKVKVSSWDPLICHHWLNSCVPSRSIRSRNTRKYCDVNADLQANINELTRNNQVQAVRNENRKHGTGTKGWWNTVNKITGSDSKALNISSVINPVDIYCFFKIINTYTQYSAPELLPIPEGTRVPSLDVHRISLLALERFCTPSYTSCHQTFLLFTQTAVSSSSMEACQHFTNSQRISTVIVCSDSTDIPYAHLRS